MDDNMMQGGGVCKCMHHKVKPFGLIIIGLAFILQNMGILSMMLVSYIWPIVLIAIGFGKMCKCCMGKH